MYKSSHLIVSEKGIQFVKLLIKNCCTEIYKFLFSSLIHKNITNLNLSCSRNLGENPIHPTSSHTSLSLHPIPSSLTQNPPQPQHPPPPQHHPLPTQPKTPPGGSLRSKPLSPCGKKRLPELIIYSRPMPPTSFPSPAPTELSQNVTVASPPESLGWPSPPEPLSPSWLATESSQLIISFAGGLGEQLTEEDDNSCSILPQGEYYEILNSSSLGGWEKKSDECLKKNKQATEESLPILEEDESLLKSNLADHFPILPELEELNSHSSVITRKAAVYMKSSELVTQELERSKFGKQGARRSDQEKPTSGNDEHARLDPSNNLVMRAASNEKGHQLAVLPIPFGKCEPKPTALGFCHLPEPSPLPRTFQTQMSRTVSDSYCQLRAAESKTEAQTSGKAQGTSSQPTSQDGNAACHKTINSLVSLHPSPPVIRKPLNAPPLPPPTKKPLNPPTTKKPLGAYPLPFKADKDMAVMPYQLQTKATPVPAVARKLLTEALPIPKKTLPPVAKKPLLPITKKPVISKSCLWRGPVSKQESPVDFGKTDKDHLARHTPTVLDVDQDLDLQTANTKAAAQPPNDSTKLKADLEGLGSTQVDTSAPKEDAQPKTYDMKESSKAIPNKNTHLKNPNSKAHESLNAEYDTYVKNKAVTDTNPDCADGTEQCEYSTSAAASTSEDLQLLSSNCLEAMPLPLDLSNTVQRLPSSIKTTAAKQSNKTQVENQLWSLGDSKPRTQKISHGLSKKPRTQPKPLSLDILKRFEGNIR